MTRRPATLWLLLVAGSGYLAAGCAADVDRSDLDGDGVLNEEDCGPQNAEVYPGAPDPYGDDVDADCDGYDGVDGDGDGYPSNVEDRVAYAHLQDCDDDDASIHPGAEDPGGDGVDQDCDGADGEDGDGDGYGSVTTGGDDCNDEDAFVHPGATDFVGDGVDQSCDGVDGTDGDRDGYASSETGGMDCDDGDPAVHPDAVDDCDGVDTNCQTDLTEVDVDGDGVMVCAEDCDDSDPAVYPGAPEDCSSTEDQNCDGAFGSTDGDGDGVAACDDCDDSDASAYPGAAERCNGIDDNCDGSPGADEGDGDNDGWWACLGDCNDSDASVHPGQWNEVANDGIDSDCDGSDAAPTLAGAAADFTGASAANLFGSAVSFAGDVDGDGRDDFLVSAPGSSTTGGAAYPAGRVALYRSGDLMPGGSFALGDAHLQLNGEEVFDFAGTTVASAGDVDGDGLDDVLVGAFAADSNGQNAGTVYLLLGSSLAASGSLDLSQASYRWEGEGTDSEAGIALAGAGDTNGDGLSDFLVGADGATPQGAWSGRSYLFLGGSLGAPGTKSIAQASVIFDGEQAGDFSGQAVAIAGDVDGDGRSEVLIGAPGADGDATTGGRSYLFYGSGVTIGTHSLSSADVLITGAGANDQSGQTLAFAGDLNGDTRSDLLVGAPSANGGGGALWILSSAGFPVSGTLSLASAAFSLAGSGTQELGQGFSGRSDLDGDGRADLVVGVPGGSTSAGAIYIFYGSSLGGSGPLSLGAADLTFPGISSGDRSGWAVASGGDANGDGLGDLVVGSRREASGSTPGTAVLLTP